MKVVSKFPCTFKPGIFSLLTPISCLPRANNLQWHQFPLHNNFYSAPGNALPTDRIKADASLPDRPANWVALPQYALVKLIKVGNEYVCKKTE
jgi:hypothetical protein